MKRFIILHLFIVCTFIAFGQNSNDTVVINTSLGEIKVKLYANTPEHRDNFLKLVKNGTYNDLLFHRVINGFMIQGGDPKSKDAPPSAHLGTGDLPYTLPAEIKYPQYFHKRGALCAARQSDNVNPEKRSSSCQFYIVHGKVYTDQELNNFEQAKLNEYKKHLFKLLVKNKRAYIDSLQSKKDNVALMELQEQFTVQVEKDAVQATSVYKIPANVREIYKTVGGTPFLDKDYTVFGEVVSGIEVVNKIAAVSTDKNNRPLVDVTMKVKVK